MNDFYQSTILSIPITFITIVFTKGGPIPFDVLQLYIPSSVFDILLMCRVPLGNNIESEEVDTGINSIPSPIT